MSKYNKQNRLDEKAVSIISKFFTHKHGDLFDLQFHGIKDNTPDTDGFIRLREKDQNTKASGKYLNQVIFFQLKGQEAGIKNNSYRCSRRLIDFCKEINLPTILLVVGAINDEADKRGYQEIYWYHFSSINTEILDIVGGQKKKSNTKIVIPNLEPLMIGEKEDIENFYTFIKSLANKNAFLDLPKEILDLSIDYKDKIIVVGSLLYLLGKLETKNKNSISKIGGIKQKELDSVLVDLKSKGLVTLSEQIIIFKQVEDEFKRDVGLLLLYEAISKIDIAKIVKTFSDHTTQVNVYKNLAKVRHPLVDSYLELKAEQIEKTI